MMNSTSCARTRTTLDQAATRRRLEALEAEHKPVSIRSVLDAARQVNSPTIEPLQGVEHGAIVLTE